MNSGGHIGVVSMNSGKGDATYAQNSARQRYVFDVLQPLFRAALERLTLPEEETLRIADLGCATGSNTLHSMDFVVNTVKNYCHGSAMPQVQAFFCDLPSNDFNDLFNLLNMSAPPYLVAGVAGSFYNLLFPRSTIHICFSLMSLHWISEVPKAVVEKDSSLYNRGRVWINGGRRDVADVYCEQSQKDLTTFMICRAKEIVRGGVMFLCLMGRPDSSPPNEQVSVGGEFCGQDFEAAWDDLVSQGVISSDVRESFNLPWYFPNAREVREAAEKSGEFEIERVEVCEEVPSMTQQEYEEWVKDPIVFGRVKANVVKSFVGSLVEAHIGVERSEMLFHIFAQKAGGLLLSNPPSRFVTCTLASLIRK